MIAWNENFKTGSDTIDQQHRTLIDYINNLECALSSANFSKADCDFLIHLVDFLECYAQTHFAFEETCMLSHRCPVHEKNKEAHNTFLNFFQQFKDDIQHKGIRREAFHNLHQTMSQWIGEHILQVDTNLKSCMSQK